MFYVYLVINFLQPDAHSASRYLLHTNPDNCTLGDQKGKLSPKHICTLGDQKDKPNPNLNRIHSRMVRVRVGHIKCSSALIQVFAMEVQVYRFVTLF